jgi:serine/threonine protein kinase
MQEAQAASALNHSNIITIYEIFRSGDLDYIAMELIPGRTLEAAIGPKGLALSDALGYAAQIAGALAAAHAAGIVHRDLKPGNIMVGENGVVKVLDFGLAKLSTEADSGESAATRTMLVPQSPKTAEGSIVGTASYMSPEQAEGKRVDHRSDVFSFGTVLYEMLTGRRAFQGSSTISTMAAILTAEPPPLSTEAKGVPHELERIVRRCLQKAPEKRWQSMADVKIALEEFRQEWESGQLAQPAKPPQPKWKQWLPVSAAALIAVGLTVAAMWWLRPAAPAPDRWTIHRSTADSGATVDPAISPDGKLGAYASDRSGDGDLDIWVQTSPSDSRKITSGLGSCGSPTISPDNQIAFRCGGSETNAIYLTSVLGGLPRKIAEGRWPKFSPDGKRIAYIPDQADNREREHSIMILQTDGGASREIQTGKRVPAPALWTPDGQGLLFLGLDDKTKGEPVDWYFISQDGKRQVATGAAARLRKAGLEVVNPDDWLGDNVLFSAGDIESRNIYRLPFNVRTHKASGDPVAIIAGPGYNSQPAASRDGETFAFAVGDKLTSNLWRVPIDEATGKTLGEPQRITDALGMYFSPNPSHNAAQVVLSLNQGDTEEIRIRDVAKGAELALAEAMGNANPVFSEDGTEVAFSTEEYSKRVIYAVPSRGGTPRQICDTCGRPVEWIAKGTKLLYDNTDPERAIGVVDVAGGKGKTVARDPQHALYSPHLSPDGRTLVFTAVLGEHARRIYVAPFLGEREIPKQDWTPVVDQGGMDRQPVWSPSGNMLLFLSERDGNRCIWAKRIDPASRKPVGAAFPVQHLHEARYSLSPFSDPGRVGLSVANGQMFFALFEVRFNVWFATRQHFDKPTR